MWRRFTGIAAVCAGKRTDAVDGIVVKINFMIAFWACTGRISFVLFEGFRMFFHAEIGDVVSKAFQRILSAALHYLNINAFRIHKRGELAIDKIRIAVALNLVLLQISDQHVSAGS